MPISVVLDHPAQHTGRRLRRALAVLAGGMLILVGLIAAIVAIPANFFALGFLAEWLAGDTSTTALRREMPVTIILLAWATSTLLAILGIRRGLRLVRRDRTLVLFLRRFGYDDATSAVTFAVARTIGPWWRLVTLDDAEIAPLGVPEGTRRFFRAGQLTSWAVGGLGLLTLRVFPAAIWGMCLVVGIDLVRAEIWRDWQDTKAWITVVDPYLGILAMTLDGRLPLDAIALTLPGAFAAIATIAAVTFVGLMVVLAALVLALPLAPVLLFVSSTATAVHDAERSKSAQVRTQADIAATAGRLATGSRKVFGARLVVLRVVSELWRQTVSQLARMSSLALVDVSEPTDNLAWEIEELRGRLGTRCVFIARHDRALRLAAAGTAVPRAPMERRVAYLLEGESILAYTSDRRGMRRFARALRAKLLGVSDDSRCLDASATEGAPSSPRTRSGTEP